MERSKGAKSINCTWSYGNDCTQLLSFLERLCVASKVYNTQNEWSVGFHSDDSVADVDALFRIHVVRTLGEERSGDSACYKNIRF